MHSLDIEESGIDMAQLTVREVDTCLGETLKREAEARGLSVNRLVLQLLRESVGLSAQHEPAFFTDLDYLAGTWSDEEAANFEHHLAGQRAIDNELWN